MASQKTLEHYLRELRLIEEHREKWCEQNVRRHYRDLMQDLQEFLGVEYAKLAQDDKLTYEILHQKGQYARFIEEVGNKVDSVSRKVGKEIRDTVQLTYTKCFEGMVDAVTNSKDYAELKANLKGIRAMTPDQVKNAVSNTFLEDALAKNHKESIYDIKRQIGVGLSQGDRMSTMANRLSEQINTDYKKSVRIVRTEAHRIREAGFQDASMRMNDLLEEADSDYVLVKTWKTMKDGAVRPQRLKGKKGSKVIVMGKGPNHMKMHGVMVLVDEPFDLGDGAKAMTPGQSGVAGHDINCRCVLVRDLMTYEEYEKKTGKTLRKKNPAAQYEAQEQNLLDEQKQLEAKKTKLIKDQDDLKKLTFHDPDGNVIHVTDYSNSKFKSMQKQVSDKILEVSDYQIDEMFKKHAGDISALSFDLEKRMTLAMKQKYDLRYSKMKSFGSDVDGLKKYVKQQVKLYRDELRDAFDVLDDFEDAGKAYLKTTKRLKEIDNTLDHLDVEINDVRLAIAKAKGIDFDARLEEIDKLKDELAQKKKAASNPDLSSWKKVTFEDNPYAESVYDYLTDPDVKDYMDSSHARMKDKAARYPDQERFKTRLQSYEDFMAQVKKATTSTNASDIKKLEKLIKDKQDEFDDLVKKYNVKLKASGNNRAEYAPRTKSAKILDKLQAHADKNSSKIDRTFADIALKTSKTTDAVKQELNDTLGEIINNCDMGVRIRGSNLMKVLDDTDGGFKNLFEVGKSGGCSNKSVRGDGEVKVFGFNKNVPTAAADIADRPIYGMMIPNLELSNTPDAVQYIKGGPGAWYGDGITCVLKKNKVFNNSSFTLGDSLDYSGQVYGSTFDNPQFNGAHYNFVDKVKEFLNPSYDSNDKLIKTFTQSDQYLEIQIHGKENHAADIIEKVYINKNAQSNAESIGLIKKLDEKGIPYEILN